MPIPSIPSLLAPYSDKLQGISFAAAGSGILAMSAITNAEGGAFIGAVLLALGCYAKGFADGGMKSASYLKEIERNEKQIEALTKRVVTLEELRSHEDPYNLTFMNELLKERLEEVSQDLDRANLRVASLSAELARKGKHE